MRQITTYMLCKHHYNLHFYLLQELDELDDANITLAAENKALHSALRNL